MEKYFQLRQGKIDEASEILAQGLQDQRRHRSGLEQMIEELESMTV